MAARWFPRIYSLCLAVARWLGSPIVDQRTGRVLGRALLLPRKGKVWLIGLDVPVVPVFLPQERTTFWKQEIGFTTHPEPDFPHEAAQTPTSPPPTLRR